MVSLKYDNSILGIPTSAFFLCFTIKTDLSCKLQYNPVVLCHSIMSGIKAQLLLVYKKCIQKLSY